MLYVFILYVIKYCSIDLKVKKNPHSLQVNLRPCKHGVVFCSKVLSNDLKQPRDYIASKCMDWDYFNDSFFCNVSMMSFDTVLLNRLFFLDCVYRDRSYLISR